MEHVVPGSGARCNRNRSSIEPNMSNARLRRRDFLAAASAGLNLSGAAAATAGVTLVQNGRSDYAIVIAPDASPSERHGAEELQNFLEEISGARLPVTTESRPRMVLVGDGPALRDLRLNIPFQDLGPEGFALRTAGPHLVIAGGRLRGSMYGVCGFLEKLGCRWFTPEVSRIPKMRTIRVGPLDEIQKPAFEYREPFFTEATDRDWAVRNKANGASQNIGADAGGRVQYYPFVHSFQALVPPRQYFDEHPEYFSLVDGKRRRERTQLCLTNPDVLKISIQTVERWIAEHPEATILSVSQNDWTGYCECDNCRRVEEEEGGAHSGPILRFVNALAGEIEKKHPDKLIDTLAYWYSEDPPTKVRPRPNVRVRLCPIGVCEAHPYETCPHNAYFMNNLRAWSKITDQLYVWHYNTNFTHYQLPFPDFDELIADIPMYKRYGVVGLFMEGDIRSAGAENAELRSYVMSRLLWDVKADARKAIQEFHEAYYGKAAGPMLAYFDLAHREVRMPPRGLGKHMWIYDWATSPYLNDSFLTRAEALFRRAEAAAESEAVRTRVRKARFSIDFVRLMQAKKFSVAGGLYQPADLEGLKARWKDLLAQAREFGIENFSENSKVTADDQNFTTYVRAYPAVTLENAQLKVHVVPELGGRITHIIDKRNGRNLLQQPDPGARQYPNLGGITVGVYSDFLTRVPGVTDWELDAGASREEASMTGVLTGGLRIRRRLRLEGPMLRTETILENTSATAVQALLQSRAECDAGNLENVVLAYRRRDGSDVRRNLVAPGKRPEGSEYYDDRQQPDGRWRLVNQPEGLALVHRFPNDQTARCSIDWRLNRNSILALAVFTPGQMLEPGRQIRLEADYGIAQVSE